MAWDCPEVEMQGQVGLQPAAPLPVGVKGLLQRHLLVVVVPRCGNESGVEWLGLDQ